MPVSDLIRKDLNLLESAESNALAEGPLRRLGMAAAVAGGLMGSGGAHAQSMPPTMAAHQQDAKAQGFKPVGINTPDSKFSKSNVAIPGPQLAYQPVPVSRSIPLDPAAEKFMKSDIIPYWHSLPPDLLAKLKPSVRNARVFVQDMKTKYPKMTEVQLLQKWLERTKMLSLSLSPPGQIPDAPRR